jgi:hypothetical protein
MRQFKEMIIRRPKPYRMAELDLNGKWLHDLGFSIGQTVNAHFQDGCLTLTTNSAAPSNIGILLVKGKVVRGRVRPQLLLNGFIIKRLGYRIYERLGLILEPNQIQISVINQYTTAETA